MVKISENVEIRIDVELEDKKAKSQMDDVLKTLQNLANAKAVNLKIDVDNNALRNLEKIEKAVKEINKLSSSSQKALFSSTGNNSGADFAQYDRQRREQVERERMYSNMFTQIQRQENQQREQMYRQMFDSIDREEKKRQQQQQQYVRESERMYSQGDREMLNGYLRQLDERNRGLRESANRESQILRQQEREYTNFSNSLSRSIGKAQQDINKLGNSGFSDPEGVRRLQTELDRLTTGVNWERVDSLTFDRSMNEVRRLQEEIRQATDVQANNRRQGDIELFSERTFSQLERFRREFRDIGSLGSEFDRIEASVRNLDNVAPDRLPQAMRGIRQEVSQLNGDLRQLNTNVGGTRQFFSDLYDSMRTFTLGNMIGNALEDGVRAIKDVVINLDSAMTDMMKVAPESFRGTSQELKQVARDANEVGKSVGKSTEDVIQGTAKALQTGAKTMSDAMEIARNSAMLANVGDLQQEQADTYIASIMSAYGGIDKALQPVQQRVQGMGKDYNNLTKFMDLANFAGNNFAISTGDVGEALQRSGSVLSEYGVSMQDSISMIVGANESIQDSAKVGTSLKSMAINLAGVKASAKDGSLELNKTAKALKEIGGIDIYSDKSTGQVKDMMTLLSELQVKYKDLAQDEQLALGEAIAGKHHANTFQALMGNWEQVIAMQNSYNEGMTVGSANKENERYLDSVAGKINVLKQNMQQLVTNVISSDFAKGLLDMAIGFTDGLVKISNAVNDLGLSIPMAIGLLTTLFQSMKFLGSSEPTAINNWGRSLWNLRNGLTRTTQPLNATRQAIRNGTQAIDTQTRSVRNNDVAVRTLVRGNNTWRVSSNNVNSNLRNTTVAMRNMDRTMATSVTRTTRAGRAFTVHSQNIDQLNTNVGRLRDNNVRLTTVVGNQERAVARTSGGFRGLINSFRQTSMAQNLLSVGTSILNGAMIGLVGAGISGLIQGLNWLSTANRRAKEEAVDNINSIKEEMSANKNKISVLGDVGKKYEELANKTNKSAQETEQMTQYANQLAEALPELKIGEDENGNAIISMAGDVDYLIQKLEQANETQAKLLKSEQQNSAYASMDILQNGESWFDRGALEQRNKVQADYNLELYNIEREKQNVLARLRNAEGDDIRKFNNKLRDLEMEKEKVTQEYTGKYIEQQQIVQKHADDIRLHALDMLQGNREFTQLSEEGKKSVSDFVSLLDFSEVTSDNIHQVNADIAKMTQSFATGQLDLESYKNKIVDIEKEFAQSGNIEKYTGEMEKLAKEISEVSGADFNIVLDMLKKMDTTSLQAESGLSKFLGAFQKTTADIQKGDGLAEALKSQYDGMEMALEQISNAGDDVELNKQIAINLTTDENLPDELKHMVRTLITQGQDPTEVLKIAQKVLIDLRDNGEVNSEEVQKMIDDAFGKGTFEVAPEIQFSDKVKVANIEQIIAKAKEELDGMPVEIETMIKTNSVDSRADINTLLGMYENFPEEVTTLIENEGYDGAYQQLSSLMFEYNKVPSELMTELKANGVNSIQEAIRVSNIYNQLPENVQTYLLANNTEALVNAKTVEEVYDSLPVTLRTDVEMDVTKVEQKKSVIDIIKDGLNKDNPTVKADMDKSNFDSKAGSVESKSESLDKKTATVKVDGDTKPLDGKVTQANKKVNSGVKQTNKTKLDADSKPAEKKVSIVQKDVNKVKQKSPIGILANSSDAMGKISGVASGIKGLPSSKNIGINVTTTYKTVGSPTPHSQGVGKIGRMIPSPTPLASGMLARSIPAPVAEPVAEQPSVFANARATSWTPIDTSKDSTLGTLKFSIELLQEMYNRISMVNNQLSLLDERMKDAVGNEKIKYLQQQNELYREQMQLQSELQQKLQEQQGWLKNELQWNGFNFTDDGNLSNYEEKLLAMEREAERLEKIAEASSKKQSEYTGDNESTKKNLQNQANADKENADKYKTSLSEVKKMLSEYIKIATTEMPNAIKEWEALNNKIEENNNLLEEASRRQRVYVFDNKLKELKRQYEELANQLELIDIAMDRANGSEKLALIQSQINLLEQQKNKQYEIYQQYSNMMHEYRNDLGKYGFQFDANQNVTNTDEILNGFENSEDLEKVNKLLEEYYKLQDGSVDAFQAWKKLTEQVKDHNDQLEEAVRRQKTFASTNKIKELEAQYTSLANKLSILGSQMENAYGQDKIALIEKQIEMLEKQEKIQREIHQNYVNSIKQYQEDMNDFGFAFDDENNVANLDEVLNKYENSEDLEKVNKLLEEYQDLMKGMSDAHVSWEKLNAEIKDAYKEQLKVTQQMEQKITEVYKKQIEERKKLIDSELDAKLKALEKEKKAYNDARAEADYDKGKTNQEQVIADLEKQIDLLSRDNSLSGQKKLQELMKQLKDEQEKLSDMVQDKIDEQVNDMFDKESDRLESEADKAKEDLDEKYSDEKLQQIVKDALSSGIFVGLDGEIQDLQDTLIKFEDQFGDGMSAMGDVIKNELVANLNVAKETMKDMAKIMEGLDLNKYSSNIVTSGVNSRSSSPTQSRSSAPIINFNSELIRVEGNIDRDVLPEVEKMLDQAKYEIAQEIVKNIR